jgi:ectoine hydroxylase-related dioxygenase (phytanoyl-CoA dioxygenase family)
MTANNNIPESSYGVLQQNLSENIFDEVAEQIRNIGFAVIDSGYSESELLQFSDEFNATRKRYVETYGEQELKSINEYNTIRSPLTHGGDAFLKLALNENLMSVLKKLIQGKFILNQQNGIINPPKETYNQAAWHRDLPYQHFVSTKPLAINALFCVDNFTIENGATFVIPASHKSEAFPSENYIKRNAIQVQAKAGSFILLDCMMFHAGGYNTTSSSRRAVNHVYNIPYFKQQINIPSNMESANLSAETRDMLGFNYIEPSSISHYFSTRLGKNY